MRAAVLNGPGLIAMEDRETPTLRPGWVRVRISIVAACEDDLDAYRGTVEHQRYPIIPGRDAVGTIVEYRHANRTDQENEPGVIPFRRPDTALSEGSLVAILPENYADRVLSEHDSERDAQQNGRCNRLPRFRTRGIANRPTRTRLGHNVDGAMAEYAVVPIEQCVAIPDNIETRDSVFLQAGRRAMYAVHRSEAGDGDYVAIIGAGDTGIIAAQLVRNRGGIPILIDTGETRLDLARSLGFEHTVNPYNAYAAEEIEWITSGDMADAVIDMTGRSDVAAQCPDFASEGGRIVYTRCQQPDAFVSSRSLVMKELSVIGCRHCGAPPNAVFEEMASGRLRVDSLVSTQLPLEAAPIVIPSIVEHPDHYMRVLFGSA
ncbi:MAG: hypothetical protein EA383_07735 [Spirochaetaceae bacterium]|nr:MAG: hypothetical protein EA383_07735 [Spirochaetaceae bacterium]